MKQIMPLFLEGEGQTLNEKNQIFLRAYSAPQTLAAILCAFGKFGNLNVDLTSVNMIILIKFCISNLQTFIQAVLLMSIFLTKIEFSMFYFMQINLENIAKCR